MHVLAEVADVLLSLSAELGFHSLRLVRHFQRVCLPDWGVVVLLLPWCEALLSS